MYNNIHDISYLYMYDIAVTSVMASSQTLYKTPHNVMSKYLLPISTEATAFNTSDQTSPAL